MDAGLFDGVVGKIGNVRPLLQSIAHFAVENDRDINVAFDSRIVPGSAPKDVQSSKPGTVVPF